MKTNYTPGQILYIKSSMGPWYYISVLRRATTSLEYANETHELHTCCDLCVDADGDCLTFARGNGSFLDLDTAFEEIRFVDDIERRCLFDALVKAFKDYDLGWAKHFTDSSYDDIRDWLCWEFNVDLESLSDNIIIGNNDPLVDTIYEITNYIWEALCKETGNYREKTDGLVVVNKQEFIEKTISYFTPILKTYCSEECVKELIDGFVNSMEE